MHCFCFLALCWLPVASSVIVMIVGARIVHIIFCYSIQWPSAAPPPCLNGGSYSRGRLNLLVSECVCVCVCVRVFWCIFTIFFDVIFFWIWDLLGRFWTIVGAFWAPFWEVLAPRAVSGPPLGRSRVPLGPANPNRGSGSEKLVRWTSPWLPKWGHFGISFQWFFE